MSLSSGPFGYNRFSNIDDYYRQEEAYYRKLIQEKKMSKDAHKKAAKEGKRWQDSDGDGKWYEKGDDVKEAIDPKGARRMDSAKGKAETEDEKNKRLMLGKYSPSVKYAKTRKEEVEQIDEISLEDMIKGYLMENGFANNEVSAEILMVNASENWLNHIANELYS